MGASGGEINKEKDPRVSSVDVRCGTSSSGRPGQGMEQAQQLEQLREPTCHGITCEAMRRETAQANTGPFAKGAVAMADNSYRPCRDL
jgi:hypothetical protein